MPKQKQYTNESLTSLKGADRVRLRPSVIFGSDGILGCQHAIFEILSNSIDEAREGYGNKINIKKYSDYSLSIQDFGRGCPVDYNESEQRYNWELAFCELYAGGKYDNNSNSGDANYSFSLGLNGLGLCSTQYSSKYMDVVVVRDNTVYELHFERGENVGGLKSTPFEEADKELLKTLGYEGKYFTTTFIKFLPDDDVFTEINVSLDYFKEILKQQAVVNSNLTFNLYDEETDEELVYVYANGLTDYVKEVSDEKNFSEIHTISQETAGRDRADKPEYKVKYDIAFCFSNNNSLLQYFHNSSFLEYGGSPDKAVKNAFVYAIDNFLKNENLYKKDDKKILFTDVEDSLILVSNSFSTVTSYENQTKKAITNKFIQENMTEVLKENLAIYFVENKADALKICNQILVNKRSRETAEKTRISMKTKLTGKIDINNRVNKFVDCRTKDKNARELYIVEGDSALGACKLARNAEFQAIIPVRGKILNCLKADYDKIFKSEIVVDLLRVIGCGVEIESKHNKNIQSFDFDLLNWDKIIICTDADYDGYQIRTLILAFLFKLVPTLIKENKVFIAESPLYEITHKKETYFAYNEAEKDKIIKKLKTGYHLQRSKGLGENEPEMMSLTTMAPATRRLVAVCPEDDEATKRMFETFLGDDIATRKEYIKTYGPDYIVNADIN